jgi:hypothetical protein
MAIAKTSVAEFEKFLQTEFPQAFSSGDIEIESASGASCCGSFTAFNAASGWHNLRTDPDGNELFAAARTLGKRLAVGEVILSAIRHVRPIRLLMRPRIPFQIRTIPNGNIRP